MPRGVKAKVWFAWNAKPSDKPSATEIKFGSPAEGAKYVKRILDQNMWTRTFRPRSNR